MSNPPISSPHILTIDAGDAYDVLGTRTVVKLSAAQTGGAYALAELHVPPGLGGAVARAWARS